MRILKKTLDKRGGGFIELIPEEHEDLWHLYNIINVGDNVRTLTGRKHQKQTSSGAVSVERIKTVLTIRVKKIDFDSEGGCLRLSGQNVCENEFVKIGQFHTISIEVRKKLSISKRLWDKIHLERLEHSSDISNKAELAAIMLEEGLAHICIITQHMTLVKQKIETSISKKRFVKSHEKSMNKFFDNIVQGINQNFNFEIVKCIIIASPGFLKEQLRDYIIKNNSKSEFKEISKNIKKFLLCHSNSGTKQALKEVLSDKSVVQRLTNIKALDEVQVLNKFFKILNENADKAIFGPGPVLKANFQKAIDVLMISDKLFRSMKVKERVKYVKLVDEVKKAGGKCYIFSSLHVSGEQLDGISGIAAILRFSIPGLYSDDEDSSDEEEERKEENEEDEKERNRKEKELIKQKAKKREKKKKRKRN